jgi:hypothetical protein
MLLKISWFREIFFGWRPLRRIGEPVVRPHNKCNLHYPLTGDGGYTPTRLSIRSRLLRLSIVGLFGDYQSFAARWPSFLAVAYPYNFLHNRTFASRSSVRPAAQNAIYR